MPRRFLGAWQGPGEVRREAVLLSPAPPWLRWRLPELWRCGCAVQDGATCWGGLECPQGLAQGSVKETAEAQSWHLGE